MKAGRVELFINVMWRELDMLVQQRPERGTPPAETLDEIFGSDRWRTEVIGSDVDERLGRAIPLIARGIGARWWTSAVRMVTGEQATRYLLLHLTNSDDGRDLMKECAWSVSPTGEFMVRRSDNPDQQFLIKPEADLGPLRDWIIGRLSRRPERWQDQPRQHGHAEYRIETFRMGEPAKCVAALPVAALPIRDGETYLVQRGKRRPALVVCTGGTPVAKDFRAGQSRWQSAPTLRGAILWGRSERHPRGMGRTVRRAHSPRRISTVRVGSIADWRNVDSPLRSPLCHWSDPQTTTPHLTCSALRRFSCSIVDRGSIPARFPLTSRWLLRAQVSTVSKLD